jgi:trk system potassium uptake protein TrkA
MRVAVVGGGRLAYFLCRTFRAQGDDVVLINHDPQECSQMARQLEVTVVCGRGSDPSVLEDAGTDGFDVVLAVTLNDEDNLVACQLARLRLGAKRTLALVHDPDNERVFRELGVVAVSTTRVLTNLIEQQAGLDDIANLVPISQGKVNVTELVLRATSPALGEELAAVSLPEDALVTCIVRENEAIIPHGETLLEEGDRLIVVTTPENHADTLKVLAGETE